MTLTFYVLRNRESKTEKALLQTRFTPSDIDADG